MNRIVVLACVLLAGCSVQQIKEVWNSPQDLRIVFHGLNAADVVTTNMRDPACMSEGNPLVGSDPSKTTINLLGLVAAGAFEGFYWGLGCKDTKPGAPSFSECIAMTRSFVVVKAYGPINNGYQLAKGCH